MNTLSKKDKAILVLSLLLFLLLLSEYVYQDQVLEIMDIEEYRHTEASVLFWLFYASVVGTDVAVIAKRPDILKLTSLISLGLIICLPVVLAGLGRFLDSVLTFDFGMYAFFIVTAAIAYIARATENSKILKLFHLIEDVSNNAKIS